MMNTGYVDKKTFVDNGRPVAVTGAATKDMYQENDALVIRPDKTCRNPLQTFYVTDYSFRTPDA